MFVQVFEGPVKADADVDGLMDEWVRDLAPGADGWLGSTGGVTEDGMLVALARFESEEAARRNGDRPEQGAWWERMAALFTAEPQFRNSTTVDADTYGDPDQAGFVQVMQGRSSDPDRSRELMAADPTDWQAFRPDILGTLSAYHGDGEWTMVIWFRSEAEARAGERQEPPAELRAMMEEMESLTVGERSFFDLRQPRMDTPA
ncbi:hypothetical protein [Nocardioides sp. P5_C9_2]